MAMTSSSPQDLVFREVNYITGQFKKNFASKKVNAFEEHMEAATTVKNAVFAHVHQHTSVYREWTTRPRLCKQD